MPTGTSYLRIPRAYGHMAESAMAILYRLTVCVGKKKLFSKGFFNLRFG